MTPDNPPAAAPPRASDHWAPRFFGELYGRIYSRHLLPASRSRAEAAFALERLAGAEGPLLDLAAGFGRHARLVAARRPVVALDLTTDYLHAAGRGLTGRRAARLHRAAGDMRVLPFADGAFGGVMMLFNSFGYFVPPAREETAAPRREVYRLPDVFYRRGLVGEDFGVHRAEGAGPEPPADTAHDGADDPNLAVLREVRRVTRRGGLFLLEAPNPAPLVRAVREAPRRHMATSRYAVEEDFQFDDETRVLHNRTRFTAGRHSEEAGYSLRLYTRRELAAALRACGFRVLATWGGYEGEPFDGRRSEMILVLASRA